MNDTNTSGAPFMQSHRMSGHSRECANRSPIPSDKISPWLPPKPLRKARLRKTLQRTQSTRHRHRRRPRVVPLQFLAYHFAVRRDCDVDQPQKLNEISDVGTTNLELFSEFALKPSTFEQSHRPGRSPQNSGHLLFLSLES